jgi:endoglucanase
MKLKRNLSYLLLLMVFTAVIIMSAKPTTESWIRINQLGYLPGSSKVAVWCGKDNESIKSWELIDATTKKVVATGSAGKAFGEYGPFKQTYRLNFSRYAIPGKYYLKAGNAESPVFEIGKEVYKGTADFTMQYMRQQRTGFNPYLKDSCHTDDGFALYGGAAGLPDSTYVDVVGGWHDASDYLQYSTTSANATYHLLMAYRDYPNVFSDAKLANGLDGKNGIPDVLDEAKWGLDWLLKMHPRADWMFNQIADDRDHSAMRMPGMDNYYGRGFQRPAYFIDGKPQVRGKFMNATTGTSSTASKLSSAFNLGASLFNPINQHYGSILKGKAQTAYAYALKIPGVTQTASVKSPYIYAEDNWVDDMELAAVWNNKLADARDYASQEPTTPWLASDTAKHYQWYPFINLGHYELAKKLKGAERNQVLDYYKQGIEQVWARASKNAFYRGVPFVWCSNNLTTSFAIQCSWYRQLTGSMEYNELEQANIDWLFGCNPWGTSMVYGLPTHGDTPVDPHSAFTHIKNYPINGGLVDGPVYTSIFKNLIGIALTRPDEYAKFQSDLAVYHDDRGDYSTNEPTMDGTASLIYLLAIKEGEALKGKSKK